MAYTSWDCTLEVKCHACPGHGMTGKPCECRHHHGDATKTSTPPPPPAVVVSDQPLVMVPPKPHVTEEAPPDAY